MRRKPATAEPRPDRRLGVSQDESQDEMSSGLGRARPGLRLACRSVGNRSAATPARSAGIVCSAR